MTMDEATIESEVYEKLLLGTSKSLRSITAKQILDDPRSRRSLNRELRRFEEKLDAAVDILARIRPGAPILILLDTDVVRKYMEIDSVPTRDSEYIRYFFEECHFDYALPAGTWKELLRYITNLRPDSAVSLEDLRFEVSSVVDDPIKTIKATVGAPKQRTLSKIVEQQLTRLIRVISQNRFVNALYAKFDSHFTEEFRALLEHEERFVNYYGDVPVSRRGRDRCDAINLAVAYTQLYKKPPLSAKREPHYILLTTTGPVLNAAKAYDETALFVLTPESFVVASELHKRHGHAAALENARQVYAKVNRFRQMLWGEALVFTSDYDSVSRRYQEIEPIDEIYAQELLDIEQSLTAIRSTSLINERQDKGGQTEPVSPRPINLRKVVDRLTEELLKLGKVGYECRRNPIEREDFGYKEYLIRLGIAAKTEELCLRIHFENPTARNSAKLFWTASWVVTCDDGQLLTSLDSIFPLEKTSAGAGSKLLGEYVVCSLQSDDDWYAQDILVTTSLGVFGLRKSLITDAGSWWELAVPKLRRFAAHFATATSAEPGPINTIEEIRLRIGNLEIAFDFIPVDGKLQRYCTVSGTENASHLIAQMYGDLGPRLVSEEALVECLAQQLKDFPTPTDELHIQSRAATYII